MRRIMMKIKPNKAMNKSVRAVAVLVLIGVLGGCAVGPDFAPPQQPEVKSFTRPDVQSNTSVQTSPNSVSNQWWEVYGSDRINTLVKLALNHNPNIEAGVSNLKQAQEYVTAQRGLYFPQIQAGYSVGRQNSGTVLSSPLVSGDSLFTLRTGQLNIGFVPDIFGANQRQVESLQAYADSQKYQLDALKITIATNVASSVIQEQLLLEQISALKDALGTAKDQLSHTRRMFESGYASRIDLAQQEAAYAQMSAMLPPLNKQLELTKDLLSVLCGSYPENPMGIEQAHQIATPEHLPNMVPSQLVSHRPDVRAAEELLHSTHALIGVAVANMLPQISLSAGVAYTGPSAAGLFTNDNKSWGILGAITAPLFSAGTLSARKRAAEQAALAAQSQYKNVVLTAFQNVADVLYTLDADKKSWEISEAAENANLKILDLTDQQYKTGYASGPQLLAAKQAWLTAKVNELSARSSYLLDTVALYQALGGGWKDSNP